ncbi:HNH nuclease [Plantibacter sp. T3]|nr:HNH nuclease [Plantibacter sp. T3]
MDFACIACSAVFKRYSTIQTRCRACALIKLHGKAPAVRTPLRRSQKPIKQRGKAAKQWDTFRDKVARPYLDNKFGIACTDCGAYPPKKEDGTYYRHDVDHSINKGSHLELKFDVTNMVYRCRNCHILKTGVPQWTPRSAA